MCEYCAEDAQKLLKIYDVPLDTYLWMCERCAMRYAVLRARG